MPRFFTQTINSASGSITGDDARHIAKVLRMRPGEKLIACNQNGQDYHCTIETVDEKQVSLKVEQILPCRAEPTVFVRLYQAMPKSDKMELIIQKAVELGVGEIIPVQTRRCVSKPDAKAMAKKLERYNRIALEAAKQCGRGIVPVVLPMDDYAQAIERMARDNTAMVFYENSTASFAQCLGQPAKTISIMVGAEGGFEPEEIEAAVNKGIPAVSLGPRILRCETAPLAALAVIMYQTGNMNM